MSTQTAPTSTSWRMTLATNADSVIKFGGLAFVALAGFAGAFRHMHDWTAEALPNTAGWLCWANAVISEILPAVSFLCWRDRQQRNRSAGVPLAVFLVSSSVSLVANLSATGLRIPGDKYFLAALPMLAVLVLFKMVIGDFDYARKDRERQAAERARTAELARVEAERQAELARNLEAERAELAAELARNFEREQAELAAELKRREIAQAAEVELQRVRIEQQEITRREEIAAAERAEQRRAREAAERLEAERRAAVFAESERIRAEADAELRRAEADRVRAEAAAKEQAAALVAGKHRLTADHADATGEATVSTIRQRRPRHETQIIADAALAVLPPGTDREDAVKAVAQAIGNTVRYAREFVPTDWRATSSADDVEGVA